MGLIMRELQEYKVKKAELPPDKSSLTGAGAKIVDALMSLLRKKEFNSITTAEISEVSGVNESLIYRYFGSKRELLHTVLFYLVDDYVKNITLQLRGIKGALNKLRKIIWEHIFVYQHDLVFAKILLLEVRNHPGFFQSETYRSIKKYASFIKEIIEEGVQEGEIRADIPRWVIMQIILSGIEHLSMPTLLFQKNLSTDELTENFCKILFEGIKKKQANLYYNDELVT
jgi:TetR/AcrR family transcriptional regulator, fatty acid metabolism regulator protein